MASTLYRFDRAVIDPDALDMLVRAGGKNLLRNMVEVFLTDAARRLAKARAAIDALDVTAIGRALHALKSSAGQMGAMHLMDLCEAAGSFVGRGEERTLPGLVAEIEAEYELVRDQLERVLADTIGAE